MYRGIDLSLGEMFKIMRHRCRHHDAQSKIQPRLRSTSHSLKQIAAAADAAPRLGPASPKGRQKKLRRRCKPEAMCCGCFSAVHQT